MAAAMHGLRIHLASFFMCTMRARMRWLDHFHLAALRFMYTHFGSLRQADGKPDHEESQQDSGKYPLHEL